MSNAIQIEKRKKVLLVEDEAHIAFTLQFNLQVEGYDVTPAVNGVIALEKFSQEGPFDVIILDVNLPEKNGFEVAKRIREEDSRSGILMLTAMDSDADRLRGLKIGVDDYITKPFNLEELMMRVNRMAQRAEFIASIASAPVSPEQVLTQGDITLHPFALKLETPKGTFELTSREAEVLSEFMHHPGKILSREHLLDEVWKVRGTIETRTVDNFVGRLRKFLEDNPAKPSILKSIRGRGYVFNAEKSSKEK